MTKTEFLQQLYKNLLPLDSEERKEIIQDFEEHFSIGLESGKTEEQICEELGSPESCAASYIQNSEHTGAPVGNAYSDNAHSTAQNYSYSALVKQNANPKINERRNNFLWTLMFFFFVLCAFGAYPSAIGLMLSPIAVVLAAIFVMAIAPSGLMIAFLVCLCVMLFTAGLLIFLVMTYLLKLSFKKSGI